MQDCLRLWSKFARDEVGIGIASQQQDLEEKHASGPDTRTAAEPGKNVFADERLDLEEKECAQEDGEGVGGSQSIQYSVFGIRAGVKEERFSGRKVFPAHLGTS